GGTGPQYGPRDTEWSTDQAAQSALLFATTRSELRGAQGRSPGGLRCGRNAATYPPSGPARCRALLDEKPGIQAIATTAPDLAKLAQNRELSISKSIA